MNEHLPECEENAQYPDPTEHDCTCAAFRACRERTLTEARDAVGALPLVADGILMGIAAIHAIDALRGESGG